MQQFRKLFGPSDIPERPTWRHRLDFPIILCAQPSVPALFGVAFLGCANGGVVAYLILLVVMALFSFPTTMLELALGQMTARSLVEVWDFICPYFKGFGFAVLMIWFNHCLKRAQNVGILVFYITSIPADAKDLPWNACGQPWNTPQCFTNGTLVDGNSVAANEFLTFRVIQSQRSIYDPRQVTPSGSFNGRLAGCIFVAWSLSVLILIFGIRILPKVLCLLLAIATFCCILLVGRLSFLPGSFIGFKYFFLPSLENASRNPALVISFVSEALCLFGGMTLTFSSYNKFKVKHCYDSLGVHLYVLVQMLLVGAMFYLASGSHAVLNGKKFQCYTYNLIEHAFLINTAPVLASVSHAVFWSLLLFFCLICFELSCLLLAFEMIVTCFLDFFGNHRRLFRFAACVVVACFGILMNSLASTPTSYALNDWVQRMNYFFIIGSLLFVFACTFHFGARRLVTFVGLMHDCFFLTFYLRLAWLVTLPLGLVLIFSGHLYFHFSFLNFVPFSVWFVIFIFQLLFAEGSIKKRLKSLVRPRWHKQLALRFDWSYPWAPMPRPTEDFEAEDFQKEEEEL